MRRPSAFLGSLAMTVVTVVALGTACKVPDIGISEADAPAIDPCAVLSPEAAQAALGEHVRSPTKSQLMIMLTCKWTSPDGELELNAVPSYEELIGDKQATFNTLMYEDPQREQLQVAGAANAVIVPHIYPTELPQDGATLAMSFEKVELTVALRSKVPDAADRLQALAGDVATRVNAEP